MNSRKHSSVGELQGSFVADAGAVKKRTPVVLTAREAGKPIGVRADTGAFVTLEEFKSDLSLGRKLASLSSLAYEAQAEFAIARLQREPKELEVGVIGKGVLSRDKIIDEIRNGTATGKEFVEIDQAWVERVKEKVSKGEYQLRGQVPHNCPVDLF
jgi:hypothetical protein